MLTHRTTFQDAGDTWQTQGDLLYADGTPFNLSAGCAIQWELKDDTGSTVLSLSLGSGITVLDAAAGTCLITLTPVQSGALAVGKYTDQLRAIDPDGYVSTQWQGVVNVTNSFMLPSLDFRFAPNSQYVGPVLFPPPWSNSRFILERLGAVDE